MTTHDSTASDTPRRVIVTRDGHGWEVREEQGGGVIRRARYTDWHRVERAAGLHGPEGAAADESGRYSTKR